MGMHVFLHTKPGVPAGSQIGYGSFVLFVDGSQKNYFCLAGTFQTRTLKPVPCFKFNNKWHIEKRHIRLESTDPAKFSMPVRVVLFF